MTKLRTYGGLIGWIAISLLAGVIGSLFEPGTWYENLAKPSWTVPSVTFSLIWPVLYLLMGIAAWLIWKEYGFVRGQAELTWYCVQLALNAGWPWLFFGLHSIGTALAEIILLWVAILFTIMLFWKRNSLAGILLIPYLFWVTYATALNLAIWELN